MALTIPKELETEILKGITDDNMNPEQSAVLYGMTKAKYQKYYRESKAFKRRITRAVAQRDSNLLKKIAKGCRDSKFIWKILYNITADEHNEKKQKIDIFKYVREEGIRRKELQKTNLSKEQIEDIIKEEFKDSGPYKPKDPNARSIFEHIVINPKRRKQRGVKVGKRATRKRVRLKDQ